MTSPWVPVTPLDDSAFAALRRRAIFDCQKWDPQVGDTCVVARYPLVIRRAEWDVVVPLAEALARETIAAEAELARRPELHGRLGLSRAVRVALARAAATGAAIGAARLIRFDFHFTADGWRISEANTDVPGGLNEASGFATLIGPHYPWAASVGDPADTYVSALVGAMPTGGTVALVHATAYSDDQQMMVFVGERLKRAGARVHLASPRHLTWRDGRAYLDASWWRGPLDLVVRFFPSDWLPGLPRACGWPHLFASGLTPISNPATSLLTQTKRWPLVWDALRTPLPTWRALLPETRDPRDAPWRTSDEWVLKPALGRVGEGIGVPGVVAGKEWRQIRRAATWFPNQAVAQRRFHTRPIEISGTARYPCLGVYTVDGRMAGAYGRLAPRELIDSLAEDAAVLAA